MDAQKYFVAKETFSQGKEALEVAKNEINQLKNMNHGRIIEYYGCKIGGNAIVIYMEYMAAGSLRQIIDDFGLIKEQAAIKYIDQIMDGLAYIHSIGIVHCDLKCANILNDGQGNVKLGDFGIAVQKSLDTANYSFFSTDIKVGGTHYWLAPEVMNGQGCSRRSDIWSFGCTVVEMLSGLPPYRKLPYLQFMTGIGNKSLTYHPNELVPSVSDQMKTFLAFLLKLEAEKRPHTATDMIKLFHKSFPSFLSS